MRSGHANGNGKAHEEPLDENRGVDGGPISGGAAQYNHQAMPRYDLTVLGAREKWTQIRWALFVFPDITDVAPTADPDVVRIFYEGRHAYANVWRVELLRAGFDVPELEPSRVSAPRVAAPSPGSPEAVAGPRAPFPIRGVPDRSGAPRRRRP
jgi:hypothetical protein